MRRGSWRQPGLFGKPLTVPKTDMLQKTEVLTLAEELAWELEKAAIIRRDPFRYLPRALEPANLARVIHAQRELWANLFRAGCDEVFRRRRRPEPNPSQLELL